MYMHLALVAVFVETVLFQKISIQLYLLLGRSLKIPRGRGLSRKEVLGGGGGGLQTKNPSVPVV